MKDKLLNELQSRQDEQRACGAARFFKTGKGEYGEGDQFWGITVPQQRSLSRKYHKLLDESDLQVLIRHPVHEVRLCALMMLVLRYQKAKSETDQERWVDVFRHNMDFVNNWDLVDSSAHLILGDWCLRHGWEELTALAHSGHLWRQRIAVIATFAFIRQDIYEPCFRMAEILLDHRHDLIHKAVGWMLREAGNRNFTAEYEFLILHHRSMPRTMLRYAIEKFADPLRQKFLKGLL